MTIQHHHHELTQRFKGRCSSPRHRPAESRGRNNGRFQPTGFPDLGPALYKGSDSSRNECQRCGNQKEQRTVNMLFSDTGPPRSGTGSRKSAFPAKITTRIAKAFPMFAFWTEMGPGKQSRFSRLRCANLTVSRHRLCPERKRDGGQETLKDWLKKPEQFAVNKQRPVRPWVLRSKTIRHRPRLHSPRRLSGGT